MKRGLLVIDLFAGLIALGLIVYPASIADTRARFAIFAACAAWLLYRWSTLAIRRSAALLSSGAGTGQKAEGIFLRAVLALMAAIALTMVARFIVWQ